MRNGFVLRFQLHSAILTLHPQLRGFLCFSDYSLISHNCAFSISFTTSKGVKQKRRQHFNSPKHWFNRKMSDTEQPLLSSPMFYINIGLSLLQWKGDADRTSAKQQQRQTQRRHKKKAKLAKLNPNHIYSVFRMSNSCQSINQTHFWYSPKSQNSIFSREEQLWHFSECWN